MFSGCCHKNAPHLSKRLRYTVSATRLLPALHACSCSASDSIIIRKVVPIDERGGPDKRDRLGCAPPSSSRERDTPSPPPLSPPIPVSSAYAASPGTCPPTRSVHNSSGGRRTGGVAVAEGTPSPVFVLQAHRSSLNSSASWSRTRFTAQ